MIRSHDIVGLFVILWLPYLISGQLWTLAHNNSSLMEGKVAKCNALNGLSRVQRPLCRRYLDHMTFVSSGALAGLEECKYQMQRNRWNCILPPTASPSKALHVGSKEVAFSYAITAAGVVHSIAKACKNGELGSHCACSKRSRPRGLSPDWKWGGCGDDTDYAYGFSYEFIDANEKGNRSRSRRENARRHMNLHNNEVGRLAVFKMTQPTCKCHGVSGSCSLKTCWMQVPDFRRVGDRLFERYRSAIEVKPTKSGKLKPRFGDAKDPRSTDLVYLESSPDYCRSNPKMAVLGTVGRECNTGSSGMDDCGLMCCGRGYSVKDVIIKTSCHCKFQWCCNVRCETCRTQKRKYICH